MNISNEGIYRICIALLVSSLMGILIAGCTSSQPVTTPATPAAATTPAAVTTTAAATTDARGP